MLIVLALETHSIYIYNICLGKSHFITFNSKMYKSKSLSSGITGTSETSLLKTATFKFPCKKGPIL